MAGSSLASRVAWVLTADFLVGFVVLKVLRLSYKWGELSASAACVFLPSGAASGCQSALMWVKRTAAFKYGVLLL